MLDVKEKSESRKRRHRRVRKTVVGTPARPRLSVFRSNRQIYVQLIDDYSGKTLAAASSLDPECQKGKKAGSDKETATRVGTLIAKRALAKDLKEVVFDRNGYLYHGRVKALADGARQAGLIF
jgi:large subunit ribosomal protein L18